SPRPRNARATSGVEAMMSGSCLMPVSAALERWGGLLIAPRSTLARLAPEADAHDGWWLGALYVLGGDFVHVRAAIGTAFGLGGFAGACAVVLWLGRALIVPIVALAAAYYVVGRALAYRSTVVLVPLVLGMTCVHVAEQLGFALGGARRVAVGGVAAASLVWLAWLRSAIAPQPSPAGVGASSVETQEGSP